MSIAIVVLRLLRVYSRLQFFEPVPPPAQLLWKRAVEQMQEYKADRSGEQSAVRLQLGEGIPEDQGRRHGADPGHGQPEGDPGEIDTDIASM
jgi:hypothetical protein